MKQEDYSKLLTSYLGSFESGRVSNFYIDLFRYQEDDEWIDKDIWVKLAKDCIDKKQNILASLEILVREDIEKYYDIADKILTDWYGNGDKFCDIEYYQDILVAMPKDYEIRKKTFSYLGELSSIDDYILEKDIVKSMLKEKDIDFCLSYGKFLDMYIQLYSNDYSKIEDLFEFGNIIYFQKDISIYLSKDSILVLQKFLKDFFNKDKDIFFKIKYGYIPEEEERTLWISDSIAYITYFLGWYDILDDVISQEWYWDILFDNEYIDYDNHNALVLSSYTHHNNLKNKAIKLLNSGDFDGMIMLSRLGC